MNNDDGNWRDHRDELLERVIQHGRTRKRRRGLGVTAALLTVVVALAAGLYLPGRSNRALHVANNIDHGTTVPARTGVLLIGDQVMLGAQSAIEQAIPEAHVDAALARQFGQAISVLDAAKRRGALPPTIIIHLGDNGPSEGDVFDQITKQFKAIIDTVGSKSEVYFVTLKLPRQWEVNVNSALYSEAGRWPNVHVLAWHDFSRSHPDWFFNDGFHLTPVGQAAYAAFLRDAIRAPVTTYSDPFAGRAVPATGLLVTDNPKPNADQGTTSFSLQLLDDAGNELGTLPRAAIGNDVLNSARHALVLTDAGIHLEAAALDTAGDLPSGCAPTEKDQALAVALCGTGTTATGMNLLGKRILVNHGSGWSQLIGLPPVSAASDPIVGHWAWASPSPDGRWVAAGWSAECEVPFGFLVSVADGSVHTVTGEAGTAWRSAPDSGIIGWQADGSAMGVFGGETSCGTSAPVQRGIYLVSPDTGSRRLLLALTPSQGVETWSSVDDQRTGAPSANPDAAIAYAYEHFFDAALGADQRVALIQGGAAMRAFIDRSFAAHAAEAAAGAIVVDRVTARGTTADVSFHALYQGHESPANPGQLEGTAVLEDGTWRISRTTYCALSANDGEPCPPTG